MTDMSAHVDRLLHGGERELLIEDRQRASSDRACATAPAPYYRGSAGRTPTSYDATSTDLSPASVVSAIS
jgi:hypothetical protein